MRTPLLTVSLLAVGLCASAAQANLIQNGSFELGTNPGAFTTVGVGGSNITSWQVATGSVDYIGSYWQAGHLNRSIDLNGSTPGSIFQVVTTQVGQLYRLTFLMSGNPDPGGTNANSLFRLNATAVGSDSNTNLNQNFDYQQNHSLGSMNWLEHTITFVATSTSTTLSFSAVLPPGNGFGAALDHVRLEAVPEPLTMTLMGGAAVAAFARVRRRRRATSA